MTEPAFTQIQKPEKPSAIGSDGFPIYSHSLYAKQQTAISPIIEQALRSSHPWNIKIRSYSSVQAILEQNSQFQLKTIFAIFERLNWLHQEVFQHSYSREHLQKVVVALGQLLDILLQRKLPCTEADLLGIVRWCVVDYYQGVHHLTDRCWFVLPLARILRCVENYAKQNRLSQDLLLHVRGLSDLGLSKTERATYDRILLSQSQEIDLLRLIEVRADEPWAFAAFEQISALEPSQREHWGKLLLHASTASQSTPSQKWLDTAQPLLSAVGIEEFKHSISQWFPLVEESTKQSRDLYSCHDLISARNKAVLTGLVWCCSLIQDETVLQWIADLTFQCFKKVPGVGPLCLKVGNAGLWLLSEVGTPAAIDWIEKLRQKVKHKSVQKQIEKAFNHAAAKAGLSRHDLEELAIPTYNLDAIGTLNQSLGSVIATLKVVGTQQVELSWLKSDGKSQKSVPAEVKQNFAAELKILKRTADDIKKTLLAQRDRLEQLYLSHRTWSFNTWCDRYLSHPLLAHLTRRLIWNFEQDGQTQLGIWHDGQLIDVSGNHLTNLSDRTQVTLWHPITSSTEAVLAWRVWLETQTVVQPFKQAHREVYLLTDAERQTHTYSNRFAAHIIRQHQFANLCQQRGWHYSLQGDFDSHNIPTWNLPQLDLQIQFWVDPASHEVAETHIYLYLSTDQVRFCELGTIVPRTLETIPSLIFSEVMRTVDLFVGVCSVGNDPNWHDHGEAGVYGNYWQDYSFGKLGTSAQLRRELLTRLLPKLRIRERCTLSDRFLIIQGDLNTYQIHLGSGNILMEPGSQYLCIVPDKSTNIKETVFLPFENDSMLSVILSKAFLLASDRTIKDKSILNQIQRKHSQ